jgi:hypothetical protein
MPKIRVLHITTDDKFFDDVFSCFEKDERLSNQAIIITSGDSFKNIKRKEAVENLFSLKMVAAKLGGGSYDVIFFHSIPQTSWALFKYIPKDKIIIWWAWGYELYSYYQGEPPFIIMDLYKKETKQLVDNTYSFLHKLFAGVLNNVYRKWHFKAIRRKGVKRIDYFQPVLKAEYELMKNVPGFRAKEFYYYNSIYDELYGVSKQASGNILLGNSSTPTNNHLDVLEEVLRNKGERQKVIMPMNYGKMSYRAKVESYINSEDVTILKDFMPKVEYFRLLETCSYACIGTVRQQAMGNVSYAIRTGIKVFLYKDSVAYKNHKELGYAVYAIEDMDECSLKTALTEAEIVQNCEANRRERERRQKIYESAISENIERINFNH